MRSGRHCIVGLVAGQTDAFWLSAQQNETINYCQLTMTIVILETFCIYLPVERFLSRTTITTTVRAMVTMTTTATTPPTIAAVLSDWQVHVLSVESACEGRSERSYTHIEYSLSNVIIPFTQLCSDGVGVQRLLAILL